MWKWHLQRVILRVLPQQSEYCVLDKSFVTNLQICAFADRVIVATCSRVPAHLSQLCFCRQIWQNYQNLYPYFFAGKSNATVAKTKKFFKDQDVWTRNMIEKFGKTDPLWRHVSYVLAQFDGLYAGYISVAKNDWVSQMCC